MRGLVNTDLKISYSGLYPILLRLGCMYAAGASAMPPVIAGGKREICNRAVALGIFEVREIVERVFAQQDVLDACARRDLGRVIMILGAQGSRRDGYRS